MQRILLLRNQLSAAENPKKTLEAYRASSTVDINELRETFFGKHYEHRNRFYKIILNDPVFKQYFVVEADRKDLRRTALLQMKKIYEAFPMTYEDYLKDPSILLAFNSGILDFDQGLSVKFGVHFALYTKTIINLGTTKHKRYIEDAFALKDIGCFGLTELAHGSNTRGILTRADYDHKTREFVINTPEDIGMKFWIGAAAHLANMCVVWAQLYIGNENYGIHAFVVPVRSKFDHSLMPGVLIGDCGLKVGLNNIDNGLLMFKNVRVSYDAMLDKFSSIDGSGKFQSPIKSADKRFGISLGSLSGGRISVTDASNVNLRNALTIALRFACTRKQFGPPGQPETTIIEYPLTQYRLIPYLAWHFACGFANYTASDIWYNNQDNLFDEKNPLLAEMHAITSVIKAFTSWTAQKGIQECREACGGLGYSAYNRLGALREENDINTTWEGDNNVLLQQTAKFLLDNLTMLQNGKKLPHSTLYFLTDTFKVYDRTIQEKSHFAIDEYNLKKAFEVRANFLIHESSSEFQKSMQKSPSPLDAWNQTQVYYFHHSSRAYGELFMFNEFHKRMKRCRDENTKQVFRKLHELFAWTSLEKDVAIFLEMGYFNRNDLYVIREKIRQLCQDLKGEVIGILDAIAPPDGVLNSPIGSSDGDIYNRFINTVWSAPRAFEKPYYWKDIHYKN